MCDGAHGVWRASPSVSSSKAGGVAENVGGRDIRTLLRRVGCVPVDIVEVDWDVSLPNTSLVPFIGLGGGAGGRGEDGGGEFAGGGEGKRNG